MNRFREKSKSVDFGPLNVPIYLILSIIRNFCKKMGSVTFICLLKSKNFLQLLIYMTLYHNAKYPANSLICSGEMVDWLRTFWSISPREKFSQIWDMFRNTANNINFHCKTNSVKDNVEIFQ